MISIDTRRIVDRLKTLESLALIPRVASTNLIARRIVTECIENELSLPQAVIVAGEQFAGRGRNERKWSSPAGKGIYATVLLTRTTAELPAVPLHMANIVAGYLRETFAIEAKVKWPNDVLVNGRKIAGILIEARIQESRVYMIVGIGVNVEPVEDDARPNAVAISEVTGRAFNGISDATVAFIEHLDEQLTERPSVHDILATWRSLTVHQTGDRLTCVLGDRTVSGKWTGIDEQGRALILTAEGVKPISAGELILQE